MEFPMKWVKQGEYYYYTQPLKNGESADFFQNVTIPAAWTSKAQDRVLGLTVTAEAVQAANFTPDLIRNPHGAIRKLNSAYMRRITASQK